MSYGTNAPWGLKPVRYMNGAPWNDQTTPYQLPSGYATSLFMGDPVTASNAGGAASGTVAIALAGNGAIGNVIVGVFQGCQYTDTNGVPQFSKYWVGGTVTQNGDNAIALIADDPMIVFDAQSNAAGFNQADFMRNSNLVAGAGSTYSGQSGWVVDGATGAGATLQVKIIRLVPLVGNTNPTSVSYNNAEVLINNHWYKAGTTSN